jgi:hypothetical protein
MSDKRSRKAAAATEKRGKQGATKFRGPEGPGNTAFSSTRRFVAWVGGGLITILSATAVAYVSGVLDLILPSPNDAICKYIEAPLLEKTLTGLLPGVLVASFSGSGGRDTARELSDEIRNRTGLPVVHTCITLPISSGAAASYDNVTEALDRARQLTKERGARIVIIGAMRSNGIADLAVTHTADEGRFEARRATVRLTGRASISDVVDVPRFIDQVLVASLQDWASLAALKLQYATRSMIASDVAEQEAESIADLADHDPPVRWVAMHQVQTGFWGSALVANASVARWHERCRAADRSYRYSRLLAGTATGRLLTENEIEREPAVALAALQTYLYCESDSTVPSYTRGQEGLAALWPYVEKVAKGTEIPEVERLIESAKPWPYFSEIVVDWHANWVLAKALLKKANEHSESPDGITDLRAALNFLKADVLRSRREGSPTESERLANSKCYNFSIEQSDSWRILVSQRIDPFPLIADIKLPDASACGPTK